jgi:hypothetical protein
VGCAKRVIFWIGYAILLLGAGFIFGSMNPEWPNFFS